MKNEELYTRIEDYVLGRLPQPALRQFEAAMQDDPALAEAVKLQRMEWEAAELLAEKKLRAQIRQAMEEQLPANPPSFFKKWGLPIALLALLAVAGVWFFQNRSSAPSIETPPVAQPKQDSVAPAPVVVPDTTKPRPVPETKPPVAQDQQQMPDDRALALSAYAIPESLSGVRGLADEGEPLYLAQEAFLKKDYRQAIKLLTPLPEEAQQEALLLRSHARFLAGEYAAAGKDFSDLYAGGLYRKEAEWFGLLANLAAKSGDKKAALKQLEAIRSDTNHPYHQAAVKLKPGN